MQKTFSIIKPDAVGNQHIGNILSIFEHADLKIAALKMVHLTREQAHDLYCQHEARPFFTDLMNFICSGPIVLLVLEGVDAIDRNRQLMGATNPADAELGTIRQLYAQSIDANAVHGSDSEEAAEREIALFFSPQELV